MASPGAAATAAGGNMAHPRSTPPPTQATKHSSSRTSNSHASLQQQPSQQSTSAQSRSASASTSAKSKGTDRPAGKKSTRSSGLFGPYALGRTLGEGEFGKVKLGTHLKTGKEVAIKLIKKENIDKPSRRAKLMREISLLQSVDHPFIVTVYDVIETHDYIGMIMEFASGGELFEHILAHRYLKERDACRFFAQLLAGVAYLHGRQIVHRDLKLENLLLDGQRNVIITDFGFANRSSVNAEQLLLTSCGSPCYAAPELVISDGYVGEAADIWSCGVILYAMLCGYLPFDDDPNNPDGDNINLLYKYILETELDFPDYVGADARQLLKRMLVPDPRFRANMKEIMEHKWLEPFKYFYQKEHDKLFGPAGTKIPLKKTASYDTPPPTPPSGLRLQEVQGVEDVKPSQEIFETAEDAPLHHPVSDSVADASVVVSTTIVPGDLPASSAAEANSSASFDEPQSSARSSQAQDSYLLAETRSTAGDSRTDSATVLPAMDMAPKPPAKDTPSVEHLAPVSVPIPSATTPTRAQSQRAASAQDAHVVFHSSAVEPLEITSPVAPPRRIDYSRKSFDVRRNDSSASRKSAFGWNKKGYPPSPAISLPPSPQPPTSGETSPPTVRPYSVLDNDRAARGTPAPRTSVNAPSVMSVASEWAVSPGLDGQKVKLRYHSGPIDQRALSSKIPPVILAEIRATIEEMGMSIVGGSGFKLRVVRSAQVAMQLRQQQQQHQQQLDSQMDDGDSAPSDDVHPSPSHPRMSPPPGMSRPTISYPNVTPPVDFERRGLAQMLASFPVSMIKKLKNVARYGSGYNKGFGKADAAAIYSHNPHSASSATLNAGGGSGHASPYMYSHLNASTASRESFATYNNASSPNLSNPRFYTHGNNSSVMSHQLPPLVEGEIRFTVEVQRIKNLPGLFVVEFKRVRGDVWEFKRVYNEAVDNCPGLGRGGV
ncbi:hypothetical protein HKX48_000081 [Thoreauomyces humboldtii]|nr:hypothetical protein HKX48_000081 [Thoreauomyces humboldtii]